MKKKIMAMALVVCLLVVAVGGATLAYFTAENTADNVFTMKGIKVELIEEFEQGSELVPGLDINKDVYVKNTGTSDAYVRVHIAIPAALDDGDPSFAAVNNFLHFNFAGESVVPGQWSWTPEMTEETGYLGNGAGNWNYYTQTIDGVDYGVYVVTYRTALAGGEQTATAALDKVYVDPSVDCEWNEELQCYVYADDKGNVVTPADFGVDNGDGTAELKIKVWAEAAQTATFTDAYDALNTAFGVPGTYNPWA